jgi:ATP synthase protein I
VELKDLRKASTKGDRIEVMRSYGEVASVGLAFVIAIVIGTGAGYWLDHRFGWSPWGLIIGFFMGFAAGVRNVYRVTKFLK